MMRIRLGFALAGTLFATCAVAQLPTATIVAPGQLAQRDVDFLRKADAANVAQLTLGNAAATKAVNPGVHSLANKVVASYKKAITAMNMLAGAKHVDLANKPTPAQHDEIRDLVDHRGADADHLYVVDVARDSEDLMAFYTDMRDNAEDGDVRAYAAEMLPEMKAHRRYASDMLAANSK
jgi:putative membrane protein